MELFKRWESASFENLGDTLRPTEGEMPEGLKRQRKAWTLESQPNEGEALQIERLECHARSSYDNQLAEAGTIRERVHIDIVADPRKDQNMHRG